MNKQINWEEIYTRLSPKMLGICRRYVKSSIIAEDLMHEAFITAIQKAQTYKASGVFDAWIYRITVNTALQYLREQNKKKEYFSEKDGINFSENIDQEVEASSKAEIIKQTDFDENELLSIIDELPEHHKLVFNLYVFENFKHKQIAKMLNISPGTSKSHLARARKKIQDLLYKKAIEKNEHEKNTIKTAILFLIKPNYIDKLYKKQLSSLKIRPSKSIDIKQIVKLHSKKPIFIFRRAFFNFLQKPIVFVSTASTILLSIYFFYSTANTKFVTYKIKKKKSEIEYLAKIKNNEKKSNKEIISKNNNGNTVTNLLENSKLTTIIEETDADSLHESTVQRFFPDYEKIVNYVPNGYFNLFNIDTLDESSKRNGQSFFKYWKCISSGNLKGNKMEKSSTQTNYSMAYIYTSNNYFSQYQVPLYYPLEKDSVYRIKFKAKIVEESKKNHIIPNSLLQFVLSANKLNDNYTIYDIQNEKSYIVGSIPMNLDALMLGKIKTYFIVFKAKGFEKFLSFGPNPFENETNEKLARHIWVDSISLRKVDEKFFINNNKISLDKVFFFKNTADLTPNSYIQLGEVALLLKQRSDNFIIEVHTENINNPEKSLRISAKRAKMLSEYFNENKINSNRIKIKAYGDTMPIDTNDLTNNLNQRVDIQLFK